VPRRDESKLETQREVSRLLDNLMHRRPRQFAPRSPIGSVFVHSLDRDEHVDAAPSPSGQAYPGGRG